MTKDAFQDLRSPELIKAHDVLGLELFNQGRDAQKKLIEQQPNLLDYFGSDYADRGETYKYTILVVLTGIDAAFLDLEFKEDGRGAGHFIAALGGPFVGIHITGGSIWLTEDLRSLNRTHARVQVIATPPSTQITMWKKDTGVYLGAGAAGGLGIGTGILWGEGKFHT